MPESIKTRLIYGLGLQTDMPIPALASLATSARVDVRLWAGFMPSDLGDLRAEEIVAIPVDPNLDDAGEPCLRADWLRDGQYLRLSYSDGTVFVIDAAFNAIWVTWPPSSSVEDTATYLLGPVLGYLLRLRGVTCLHASAVAVDDRCIALVGPSGAGKSTTAAAFAQLGFPVLSDDVVPLLPDEVGYLVPPAYPRVRLWQSAVEGLFGSPEALPLLTPNWDKRFLDLDSAGHHFQATPLPLAGVYFLGDLSALPEAPIVETISARDALMTLVGDTYGTHFLDPPRRAREFELLGQLVKRVPLRRVQASTDISRIHDLCLTIVDDVRRTAAASP